MPQWHGTFKLVPLFYVVQNQKEVSSFGGERVTVVIFICSISTTVNTEYVLLPRLFSSLSFFHSSEDGITLHTAQKNAWLSFTRTFIFILKRQLQVQVLGVHTREIQYLKMRRFGK